MDLYGLYIMAMFQLSTARDAPLPVVLAAVVAGVIVWQVTRWRQASVIHNLKRGIARRDAELTKLRAHLPMGEDGAPADAGSGPLSTDRRKALRLVVNAIDQAELALRATDAREADRASSGMALALQAVNRVFGLPVPGTAGSATDNLTVGKAYLERVRPALRNGEDEEARHAAVAFLSSGDGVRRQAAG